MQKFNNLPEKQDKELVELLTGGSHEALGELYARYRKQLMYYCKQYMRNEVDAEDIVQDVFLRIWERRHFLNPELSFSGFMQTLAKNCITDKFRHLDVHSRYVQNRFVNGTDLTNETEDAVIDSNYMELLNELIERLPQGQKEIFRLSRMEGLTHQEIAELLQTPAENVRKQVSRATKKMKDLLSQHTDIHFQMVITIWMFFS